MFRDLKEYQEIAKIYAEKVSKPENIDENRNTRGSELRAKRLANKNAKLDIKIKQGIDSTGMGNQGTAITQKGKEQAAKNKADFKMKKDIEKIRETEPENQSKEFGTGGQPKASVQIKRARLAGKTGREKAQELAKMRIGSGTAKNPDTKIEDLKKANTKSMKERAKARFEKFKADREAKRLERMKEEYTPYDMVLEYLLSSKQAATIEEANYIMTEMDAKTIQSIISD